MCFCDAFNRVLCMKRSARRLGSLIGRRRKFREMN